MFSIKNYFNKRKVKTFYNHIQNHNIGDIVIWKHQTITTNSRHTTDYISLGIVTVIGHPWQVEHTNDTLYVNLMVDVELREGVFTKATINTSSKYERFVGIDEIIINSTLIERVNAPEIHIHKQYSDLLKFYDKYKDEDIHYKTIDFYTLNDII